MMNTILKYLIIISIMISASFSNAAFDSFKLSLENSDTRVKEILLDGNINRTLARAEAVVLLDAVLVNNTFAKDMSEYFPPYADVDISSEYSRSVTRLAYFKGLKSIETPLTKNNTLFRPLDKVSRQEFVKMIVEGGDVLIDDNTNYIIDFTDKDTLSSWAVKYMNTAVHYGLVVGDNNYLKPLEELSIYEALLVLYRVELLIQNNANVSSYTQVGFETSDTIDFSERINASIGDLDVAEYYIANVEPLEIHSIDVIPTSNNVKMSLCGSSNVLLLEANTTHSTRGEVSLSFQWESNGGYFKKVTGQNAFKKVCFYPANNNQAFDYLIKLTANDNIGYSDTHSTNLATTHFTYTTSSTNTDLDAVSKLEYANFSSVMTAGRPYSFDISSSQIIRSGLNLGIENITVYIVKPNGERLNVYSGDSTNGLVSFSAPVMPNWYGQNMSLEINLNTQNFSLSVTTPTIQYVPVYEIFGTVYNNINSNEVAKNLTINGQNVEVSEDNTYSYELPTGSNLSNIIIDLVDKTDTNYFEPVVVSLSALKPSALIDFFGFYQGANESDTNLDPTQPSTTLLPQYIQADKSFKVSWQSQNSDNITIQYSFDQSTWLSFASINMASHAGDNSHTATIAGSLDKTMVYFKVTSFNDTSSVTSSPCSLSYSSQAEDIPLVIEDDFYVTWKGLTQVGGQYTAEVTQRYIGNREAYDKDVYVGIYLSSDTTCTTSDTRLGSAASSLSAADTFDTENISISLPSRTNSGTWYLCAIADYKNEHTETSETNNASYIMLRDGAVVDALDEVLLVSGAYDDTKDTFSISWTSQNFSEKKRIYYSYNNSSWEFIESYFEDEGIIVTHIPDSLNHSVVYLKVEVATQYGLARSNIYVLNYTPSITLNTPVVQVISDKVIKVTWDPASCITSHYAITRTGGGETDKFVYLDTKDYFIDYFVTANTSYTYSLSCSDGPVDYYRNGFSYSTPHSEAVTTNVEPIINSNWVSESLPTELVGRRGYKLISFKNKLWIIGGVKDSVYQNDSWFSLDGINWVKESDNIGFIAGSDYYTVVNNNRLYIFRGYDGSRRSPEVWSSADGFNWQRDTSTFPVNNTSSSSNVVSFNGKILLIGGRTSTAVWSSNDGQIWTNISNAFPLSEDFFKHTSFIIDNKIYVVGGEFQGECEGEECLNKDIWTSTNGVNWIKEKSNVEFGHRGSTNIVKFKDYIYAIGGSKEIPNYWYERRSIRSAYPNLRNANHIDIWRSTNGLDWENVTYDSGLAMSNLYTSNSIVYNNRIYFTYASTSGDTNIYSTDLKNTGIAIRNINNEIKNGNSITLKYRPVKEGAFESYEILIGTDTNNLLPYAITTDREAIVENLEYATTYYVEMYLLDSSGNRIGNTPSKLTFSTGFDTREIVDIPIINVGEVTTTNIALNWGMVANADRYIILRSVNGGIYEVLNSTIFLEYLDSENLREGNGYRYIIKAVNANGFTVSTHTSEVFLVEPINIEDRDNDGYLNNEDAFPDDPNEWLDTDGDGIGDNADDDNDNDGYHDGVDAFPLNPREWLDTDNDGTGNNADRDDDNDGISDVNEIKWGLDPLDPSDGGDDDIDGDGVSNADEIEAGSDPLDPDDTKKPKRFVPIVMDDIVIMVPMVN